MKQKTDPNDFAFPIVESSGKESVSPGLTIRQYYAGLAMQGLCATGNYETQILLALDAVKTADALIARLNKETE